MSITLDVLEKAAAWKNPSIPSEAAIVSTTRTQDGLDQKPKKTWQDKLRERYNKDYENSLSAKIDRWFEKKGIFGSQKWKKDHPGWTGFLTQHGGAQLGLTYEDLSKQLSKGQLKGVWENEEDRKKYNRGRGAAAVFNDLKNIGVAFGMTKSGAQAAKQDMSTRMATELVEGMAKSAGHTPHRFPRGMFDNPVMAPWKKQAVRLLSDYYLKLKNVPQTELPISPPQGAKQTVARTGDGAVVPTYNLNPADFQGFFDQHLIPHKYYQPGQTTGAAIMDSQAKRQMRKGLKSWKKLTPEQKQKAKAYGIEKKYFKNQEFEMLNPLGMYFFGDEEDFGENKNQVGGFFRDYGPYVREMYIHPFVGPKVQKTAALHEEGHSRQNVNMDTPASQALWKQIYKDFIGSTRIPFGALRLAHGRGLDKQDEYYYAEPTEVTTRLRQLNRYFNKKGITPTEELIMNPTPSIIKELDHDQRNAWYNLIKSETIRKDYLDFLHSISSVEDKERTITV